jgi:hypothetical protein
MEQNLMALLAALVVVVLEVALVVLDRELQTKERLVEAGL